MPPLLARPLVLFALAFGLGALWSRPLPNAGGWAILPPLVLASLRARRGGVFPVLLLALAYFWAGNLLRPDVDLSWPGVAAGTCARTLQAGRLPAPGEAPARLEIEGVVLGTPIRGERRTRATIRLERARPAPEDEGFATAAWTEISARFELSLSAEFLPLPGDRLRARVRVDDPPPATPVARRAFEERRRRGIACLARVEGNRVAVLDEARGLFARVEVRRRKLGDRAREILRSPEARALVPALMVGEQAFVASELREAFTDSGLAHILSVSGLHLTVCVLGAFRLLRSLFALLGRVDADRWAAILVLPLAPLYAAFTGAQPPVMRAAVGAALFLFARGLVREADGWTSLAVAFLGLVALDPPVLHSPSFQLSFAACAGMLGLSPTLRALLPRPRAGSLLARLLEPLASALVATTAATLATLPFVALYFQRVSLSSLLANVVVVPVGLGATVLCALAGAAGLVLPSAFDALVRIAGWSAELLAVLARFFASLPGSRIPLPPLGPAELLAFGALLASLALLRRSRPAAAVLAAIGLAIVATVQLLPPPERGRLVVEFLPVGQGDAVLLRLPRGETVLVDTGGDLRGEEEVAQTRILPLLAERGVRRLRALVLSHLHPDHAGSAPEVLRRLRVDEVWFTGRPLQGPVGARLAEALRERGVPLRRFAAGSPPLALGGVVFEFLGPPDPENAMDEPLFGDNDASLVLRIRHGEVAVLLPGDVEAEGERALLESGAELSARLLKSPHHGSRTSSTEAFLELVRPEHVVFCVGWRNPFGFPHPEVVERYRRLGATIHRTDTGPVAFVSDGRTLSFAGRNSRQNRSIGFAFAPDQRASQKHSGEAGALAQRLEQRAVVLPERGEDHRAANGADQIDGDARQERPNFHAVDAAPAAPQPTEEGLGGDAIALKLDLGREVAHQQGGEEERHQHGAQVGAGADALHLRQHQQHGQPDDQAEDGRPEEKGSGPGDHGLRRHAIQSGHSWIIANPPPDCTPGVGTARRATLSPTCVRPSLPPSRRKEALRPTSCYEGADARALGASSSPLPRPGACRAAPPHRRPRGRGSSRARRRTAARPCARR
ncbi:MAG: DNA internalization-related competence protein ComEC/Rec2 [Pseudomonadota bacterium]